MAAARRRQPHIVRAAIDASAEAVDEASLGGLGVPGHVALDLSSYGAPAVASAWHSQRERQIPNLDRTLQFCDVSSSYCSAAAVGYFAPHAHGGQRRRLLHYPRTLKVQIRLVFRVS